jgi:hypothetical protein
MTAATVGSLGLKDTKAPMWAGVKSLYNVGADLNRFVNNHLKTMMASSNPTTERSGRVLASAKEGFQLGYATPVIIIAAGQLLLGNPLSAATTMGTAVVASNPVAMTCAALGAIYFGYSALSENEKEALLLKLHRGLDVGLELIRSVVSFTIGKLNEFLNSENFAEIKVLVKDAAALFGKHLGDITRAVVDRVADSFELVKQTSGKAATSASNLAVGGIGHIKGGSIKAAVTARDGITSAYDRLARKKDRTMVSSTAKPPKLKKPKKLKPPKEPKKFKTL